MREIKFRAWDKFNRNMIQDVSTHRNDEGDINPWEFMQFTGLRDKNGKEIYEGDLVMWKGPHYVEGVVGQIEYIEPLASFVVRSPGSQHLNYEITRSLEIIGNIHENPEGLK